MDAKIDSKLILNQFTVVKRAIIYSRVSTDEQAESGTSLDNQDENSLDYAAAQGMRLVAEPFREDYTGTTLDRPVLGKVRAMLRAGQVDALIVYKTDRLDRSEWGTNLLILLQELKALGVELHYSETRRQVDMSNPQEMLLESIKGWQSGEERNTIVKRLRDGKINRVKNGGIIVAQRPPYGYELVKNGKLYELKIDESEATIIRLIFHWYGIGEKGKPLTIGEIQRCLNELAPPTFADTGKRKPGKKKKTDRGVWGRGTIHQILKNETYIGTWHYNKHRRVGSKLVKRDRSEWIAVEVPAIIDYKTFEAAQERLRENKKLAGSKPKYECLMRRRLFCTCGYKCGVSAQSQFDKLYYECPGRRGSVELRRCNLPLFRADKIDAVIWEWVRSFFENPQLLEQGIARYEANQESITMPLKEELKAIRTQIAEQKDALAEKQQLYEDLKNRKADRTKAGLLNDMEQIEAILDTLDTKGTEVEAKLRAATLTEQDVQAMIDRVNQIKQEVKEGLRLADDLFKERRWLIERLNVEGTLLMEDGKKIIEARCYFGEKRIELSNTSGSLFYQQMC